MTPKKARKPACCQWAMAGGPCSELPAYRLKFVPLDGPVTTAWYCWDHAHEIGKAFHIVEAVPEPLLDGGEHGGNSNPD